MAFIPVANCVQARLILQEDNGVQAQNVFYHATSGVPTNTDMEDIGAMWATTIVANLITSVTVNWAWLSCNLRAMNEAEGLAIIFTDGFGMSGTNAEVPTPDQVAYTITWNTGLVGRSARGRTYQCGVPTGSIIDRNRLTDAAHSDYQNRWDNIREDFEGAGHALQVVSFQEGGVVRAAGRALPALSCNVRFPLATQRRRLA